MKQRQRAEDHVVLVGLEQTVRRLGVGEHVVVGQLGALGLAGSPRRVEDHRRVGAVALGELAVGLGVGEQLLELTRLDEDDLGVGVLGALLGGLAEVAPREQPLGLGVLEVELDLAALEQHVHRDDGAARAQDAVVGDREVRDVREHDPDAVAGLEPLRLQEARHAGAALVDGLPVDLCVVELVGDALRDPLRGLGDDRRQVGAHCEGLLLVAPVEAYPAMSAATLRQQTGKNGVMPALPSRLRKPFSALTSLAEPPPPGSRRFAVWKRFTGLNNAVYRASGGRLLGSFDGNPVLLLHHVGRRSGEERVTPLLYLPDGDDLVIVGSMGGTPKHPAWFHNLTAQPETEVEVGRERRRVRARVAGPDERERLWPRLVEHYPAFRAYQARTEREIPVVILTLG